MALIPHSIFLLIFSVFVHRYGAKFEFNSVQPDFFLMISLYLFSRSPYPHLILLTAATGWCSDLFGGHNWASDACFMVLIHLFMEKMGWCKAHKSAWVFGLSLTIVGALHVLWSHWLNNQHFLGLLPRQLMLNLMVGWPMFWIFRTFKLGWGIQRDSRDMPVLNA